MWQASCNSSLFKYQCPHFKRRHSEEKVPRMRKSVWTLDLLGPFWPTSWESTSGLMWCLVPSGYWNGMDGLHVYDSIQLETLWRFTSMRPWHVFRAILSSLRLSSTAYSCRNSWGIIVTPVCLMCCPSRNPIIAFSKALSFDLQSAWVLSQAQNSRLIVIICRMRVIPLYPQPIFQQNPIIHSSVASLLVLLFPPSFPHTSVTWYPWQSFFFFFPT